MSLGLRTATRCDLFLGMCELKCHATVLMQVHDVLVVLVILTQVTSVNQSDSICLHLPAPSQAVLHQISACAAYDNHKCTVLKIHCV